MIVVVLVVSFVVVVGTVALAVLISELFQYSRKQLHPTPISKVFTFMSMFPETYWHDSLTQQLNDNINYTNTYIKTTESLTDPHLSV
jgi:hypothetical protein